MDEEHLRAKCGATFHWSTDALALHHGHRPIMGDAKSYWSNDHPKVANCEVGMGTFVGCSLGCPPWIALDHSYDHGTATVVAYKIYKTIKVLLSLLFDVIMAMLPLLVLVLDRKSVV